MLVGHREEVQRLLLEKKSEFEEETESSTPIDDDQQVVQNGGLPKLQSPLPDDAQAIKARHADGLRGLPPLGVFSSPKPSGSPRSPMKRPY